MIIKKEKLLGGIIILVKVENQLGPGNTNAAIFQFKFQFQNFKLKLSIFKTDIDNSLELRTKSKSEAVRRTTGHIDILTYPHNSFISMKTIF